MIVLGRFDRRDSEMSSSLSEMSFSGSEPTSSKASHSACFDDLGVDVRSGNTLSPEGLLNGDNVHSFSGVAGIGMSLSGTVGVCVPVVFCKKNCLYICSADVMVNLKCVFLVDLRRVWVLGWKC